jgi:hypothetical protein
VKVRVEKVVSLYNCVQEVKVLVVFLEFWRFFGRIFLSVRRNLGGRDGGWGQIILTAVALDNCPIAASRISEARRQSATADAVRGSPEDLPQFSADFSDFGVVAAPLRRPRAHLSGLT